MSVDPKMGRATAGLADQPDALRGACTFANLTLPEPLPAEPMGLVMEWINLAGTSKTQPNPNAMTLATVDGQGRPSARIVLCRKIDAARGVFVFYTNYDSRKGLEAEGAGGGAGGGHVALVFHWDHLDRQIRIEGRVTRSPEAESDAYFATRPALSRVAAWASDQSRPLASRAQLLEQNRAAEARFGVVRRGEQDSEVEVPPGLVVPRPGNWGGFRVWAEHVELWLGHSTRLHDRARWSRALTASEVDGAAGYAGGGGTCTRLQP